MSLESFSFGAFIIAFLIVYPYGKKLWRQASIIVFSIIFLATYINNVISAVALITLVLVGYAMTKYAQKVIKINVIIVLYIIVSISLFMIIKKYEILYLAINPQQLNHQIFIIGYSYLLFRQIHVLIDSAQGVIKNSEIDVISYTIYCLHFLTLLAGPIQRYPDFKAHWDNLGKYEINFDEGLVYLNRIAGGYVAAYVISYFFLDIVPSINIALDLETWVSKIITFYTYPLGVFFNFAGYCSIVIGIGGIIGLGLPENFNKPYFARDPLDFWRRWHITLSEWLRDYIFTPLYKWGVTKWSNLTTLIAFIGYFITFLIAGLWHGTSISFFILGIIYGSGAAITNLIEIIVKKWWGRKTYKALYQNHWVTIVSIFVTWHFIAFSFLFLDTG